MIWYYYRTFCINALFRTLNVIGIDDILNPALRLPTPGADPHLYSYVCSSQQLFIGRDGLDG